MAGGRPLKFQSVEELQKMIDAYFAERALTELLPNGKIKPKPITITGLALALDTTRETLCDYSEKDGFSDTIKRAKLRVENYAEEQVYLGRNAAGPIFILKNFNWKDSVHQTSTVKNINYNSEVTAEEAKEINKGLEEEF